MNRRILLKSLATLPLLSRALRARAAGNARNPFRARVRPGDPGWPSASDWSRLSKKVEGRLLVPRSPLAECIPESCRGALDALKNPFYIGDEPGLTQTSGWIDAWTSQQSAYAVAAASTQDVIAAVNFARDHRVRLVVKGGGHSYQGTSQAADSLLIWTRSMNSVVLHDAFVPQGCGGKERPEPAVSIGAGAMWIDAYQAVTTQAGRYVQGGGCTSVGVAGLVQSGGFGSFSKKFGCAAAGLLEAEIVTADGVARIVNECQEPDLFYALRGGGGGSFGVVTRLVLRTRPLPESFGGVFGAVAANSDAAYRRLIAKAIGFYRDRLFGPHWGEQLGFGGDNVLQLRLVFQGLGQAEAEALWSPFLEWVRADTSYRFVREIKIMSLPARHFWDAEFLKQHAPAVLAGDSRPAAPAHHFVWAGDEGEVGWFIHGYRSAFMPSQLLADDQQARLAEALFAASRHWPLALHFNKGLAGSPAEELAAARQTALNPEALDAFALAICAGGGAPAYAGMPGPDLGAARADAAQINRAMDELLRVAPAAGSYVSESNYFEPRWQRSFWGGNYAKLAAVKHAYDPEGLLWVHHGVGSEEWSDDGFTPRTS
ncbi:MAG: FAD-binding oxidoreductase [Steroidobacteraceae bacterium]